MKMKMNLTQTQLSILRSAVRRQNGIVALPRGLKGPARRAAVGRLLKEKLIRAIPRDVGMPTWCFERGEPMALQITAAGALLVLPRTEHGPISGRYGSFDERYGVQERVPRSVRAMVTREPPAPAPAKSRREYGGKRGPSRRRDGEPSPTKARRAFGRTRARQPLGLALLARPDGISLVELAVATGWQAHTVRAWVSRLRKRGTLIEASYETRGRARYRLASPPFDASTGAESAPGVDVRAAENSHAVA